MAKTNHSHKSSQKKPEAPPPAMQSAVNAAPGKQEASMKPAAPAKQEVASKQEIAPKQEAPAQPQETSAPAPVRAGPSDEQIAHRAYELFLARGGEHGHHDADWHQAERELGLGR